jgi:hypothetical protein
MKLASIGLELKMKHKSIPRRHEANNIFENLIGTLYFTVTPVPAFSSSGRGQNTLEHLPGRYPSNISPGIFSFSQTEPTSKKSPGLFPVDINPLKISDELFSVLDLDATFKEPDEIVKPELFIRRAFRDIKREIRLVTSVGVRHPVRYIRDRRQMI